ncbi:hypothetical protein [Mobilicoccus massiliensis]|uniref:hypothetical protein n=1 Tax=Mobilicoccus massiliensis TaxID=1522310 RepID=UPI000693F207|nr:hypothetical protein [Mobilicoccus massiliensis]
MTFADLWRRENAVQTLDFWLDYEGVPRARRRTERREVRTMLDDLARSEGMRAAVRSLGPMRDLARTVGEGYPGRPRWSVGAAVALPVFAVLLYSYFFSAMAFLEGVRASGVTGREIDSRTVAPWFGARFTAFVEPDGGAFSVGGDSFLIVLVVPLIVFLLAARPWRLFTSGREPAHASPAL